VDLWVRVLEIHLDSDNITKLKIGENKHIVVVFKEGCHSSFQFLISSPLRLQTLSYFHSTVQLFRNPLTKSRYSTFPSHTQITKLIVCRGILTPPISYRCFNGTT